MRLGKGCVKLQSSCRRLFRFGKSLARTHVRVKRQATVGVRQPGVERSILRTLLNSLAEINKREIQIVRAALIERILALQVEIVCVCINADRRSRRSSKFQPDLQRDGMRHFGLESENIV